MRGTDVIRQCGAFALLLLQLIAAGADEPTPTRAADANGSLASILEDLARRHNAHVLLDPEVPSTASSWRPKPESSLAAALGSLVASTKGLAWRRLYRAEGSVTPPPAKELAVAARALEGIAVETLLVETPGARETWIYRQTQPTREGLSAQLTARGLNGRPLYLIYLAAGSRDGLTAPRRLATLERRQIDLPLREEHLAHAIADEGRTVLFSSHLLSEVERVADRVAMMHRGRLLFCDPLDELKDAHCRITLCLGAPRQSPPPLEEALLWEGAGEHWTAICRGRREQIEASAALLGARIVRESRLSLDEIFAARVGAGP